MKIVLKIMFNMKKISGQKITNVASVDKEEVKSSTVNKE
jgi:hypothetical protein